MNQSQAVKLLFGHWEAQWPIERPTSTPPYAFENELWRPPEGSTTPLWLLVFARHMTSKQMTHGPVGSRRFEHKANIYVLLFGELDKGRDPVDLLAVSVLEVLKAQRLGTPGDPLQVDRGTVQESGRNGKTSDGMWYQQQATIPFRYYSIE